jgi:DNA-directed RNA polymerase subunit beta
MLRKQSIVTHLTRLKDLCFPFSLNPLKQRKKEKGLGGWGLCPLTPLRNRNIKVKGLRWEPIEYSLETFQRSNQDTVLTNKPSVFEGSWVQSGDLLTDCASSVGGELSLGQNLLIAYMPWEGYNFEDAILISERLVVDDLYTSVHIERYDVETYQTKLGSEEITRDIPNVSEKEIEKLDSFGIIKMGSWVEENDILVGKVTPINKKNITPYQKLLYTILKTPFRPIRDNSLRAPKGIKAKVIDIKYFLHPYSNPPTGDGKESRLRKKSVKLDKTNTSSRFYPPLRGGKTKTKKQTQASTPHLTEVGVGSAQKPTRFRGTKSLLNSNSSKNKKMFKTIKSFYDLLKINRFFIKNYKTSALSKNLRFLEQPPSLREGKTPFLERARMGASLREGPLTKRFNFNFFNEKKNSLFSHFYKKLGKQMIGPGYSQGSLDLEKQIKLWKNKLQLSKLDKKTKLTQHNFQLEKMRRNGRDYYYRSVISPNSLTLSSSTYFKYGQKPYFYRGAASTPFTPPAFQPEVGTGLGKVNISQSQAIETSVQKDNNLKPKNLHKSKKKEKSILNPLISLSLKDKDKAPNLRQKNLKNIETIQIYLAEKRKIQVGDKMAGRHGNKGIVSQILPIQDMPYLPDGTPIDMVLNPLGVPSRMNVGQIYECLLGLAGKYLGEHYKVYSFDETYGPDASRSFVFNKLYEARLKNKLDWLFNPNIPGKIRIYDGRTGECFDQPVTVGQAYMLRLVHMVDDKIHMRSTGPYSLVTQQPLRGRSKQGGQRLGEMEVWALEGYGAAFTLLEMLTIKSDDMIGRQNLWTNFILNRDISIGTPESFKVLVCELQALCLDIGLFRYSETLDSPNQFSFNSRSQLSTSLPSCEARGLESAPVVGQELSSVGKEGFKEVGGSTFTDPNKKESIQSSTKPYLREIPHLINLP